MKVERKTNVQALALAAGLCITLIINHSELTQSQALGNLSRRQEFNWPIIEATVNEHISA
uniref:Uncharacterized protein n=1 Tax=Cyanothece sp. (strain PCC 7425 / ATCC 29141) TaxID=395961 RepID=B8HZC7_CYAP4